MARRCTGAHRPKGTICHWLFCQRCGLIYLKNAVSRAAVAAPCVWWEDE